MSDAEFLALILNPFVYGGAAMISGIWFYCISREEWAERTLLWRDLLFSLFVTFCPILNLGVAFLCLLTGVIVCSGPIKQCLTAFYWRHDPFAFLNQPVRRQK